MTTRTINPLDHLIVGFDKALRVVGGVAKAARPNPGVAAPDCELNAQEQRHSAGLMRVNHAGEVAAQALYHGQALTARDPQVREHLLKAAAEEQDHLRWCEERLGELGEGPSKLKPLWYAGSFAIGAAAGLAGDKWSLGFVAETEKQVSEHLGEHLDKLPSQDEKSRSIISTMQADETRHGREATEAGGRQLPTPIRELMKQAAKVMKRAAYRF